MPALSTPSNKPYNTRSGNIQIQNVHGLQTKTQPALQNSTVIKPLTTSIKAKPVRTVPKVISYTPPVKLDPPPPPPPALKILKNKSLLCKPFTQTKAISCKPRQSNKGTNTGEDFRPKVILIPVPVPIYVPVPVQMYNSYVPTPIPTPLPVPVPMWLPVASNNADKLLKTIDNIKERLHQIL
ncbi:zinc finger MYM-type protein 4-like [Saccoglossus kowalevskii]|uniref:Zinc finger MYM-type protein 4-like n=1 Tax=Saccoglossus kowalevskii TaxID=10224 RepID=A0ABM0LYT1_SACKO|nr:PREDICTED: zinc finger MYM-type protein 4-like [Saccoglossus kowalevskii]